MAAAVRAIRDWLSKTPPSLKASPSIWSTALEQQQWQPEAVALVVTLRPQQWKPLLRWWRRWRRIQAPQTARDLIAAGWQPGPAIGEELRRQRRPPKTSPMYGLCNADLNGAVLVSGAAASVVQARSRGPQVCGSTSSSSKAAEGRCCSSTLPPSHRQASRLEGARLLEMPRWNRSNAPG